jgi:hypothetical protein
VSQFTDDELKAILWSMNNPEPKKNKMDKYLMFLTILTLGIIGAYFYTIFTTGIEPTVLVDNWFRVVIAEVIAMMGIKISKEWRSKE